MIRVAYQCKRCLDEIPVEVRLGESNDLPDACPACSAPIPDTAHAEVEESAISKAEFHDDE